MSTFNGQNLFASGPHTFQVGGLSLRHVLQETPGGRGMRLSAQGQHGRSITQMGQLLADNPVAMQTQMQTIETLLDGQPYTLVDDTNRSWSHTVMLAFEPKVMRRLGSPLVDGLPSHVRATQTMTTATRIPYQERMFELAT